MTSAPAVLYREYPPCPALRPYVECYGRLTALPHAAERSVYGFQSCGSRQILFRHDDPLLKRVVPTGQSGIFLHLGDAWTLPGRDETAATLARCHVVGAQTRPLVVEFGPRLDMLGVVFRPGRAHAFFRLPADCLTDRFQPLEDLWGSSARLLQEQVRERVSPPEQIRALEAELLRRLVRRHPPAGLEPVLHAIRRTRGGVSVELLSRSAGISRQHLTRQFKQFIGISPKFFCRVVRFEAVVNRALARHPSTWADAAVEFGYFDQAHLIAEFNEFTGLSPGHFFPVR